MISLFLKKALQVKKSITLDTRENRLVKHIILSIIDKLNEIKNKYNKLDRKKRYFFNR